MNEKKTYALFILEEFFAENQNRKRKIVILITLLLASKFTMQKKNVHTWKLQ